MICLGKNFVTINQEPLPRFFVAELNRKQVRNYSKTDLMQMLFGKPIYLNNYTLYTTGKINGVKKLIRCRILECEGEIPLYGRHRIAYGDSIYEVNSLTTFKQKLGFNDRLSFDRVTFIVDGELQKAIRLSTIRPFLCLPRIYDGEYTKIRPYFYIPSIEIYIGEDAILEEELTKYVEGVISGFSKILPGLTRDVMIHNLINNTYQSSVPTTGTVHEEDPYYDINSCSETAYLEYTPTLHASAK